MFDANVVSHCFRLLLISIKKIKWQQTKPYLREMIVFCFFFVFTAAHFRFRKLKEEKKSDKQPKQKPFVRIAQEKPFGINFFVVLF